MTRNAAGCQLIESQCSALGVVPFGLSNNLLVGQFKRLKLRLVAYVESERYSRLAKIPPSCAAGRSASH